MSHTRFVSRLLKLTRGTSKAAPVVFLILERNLKPDDLDAKVLVWAASGMHALSVCCTSP